MCTPEKLSEFLDLNYVDGFAICLAECQTQATFDINAVYERPHPDGIQFGTKNQALLHIATQLGNVEIVKLLLVSKLIEVNCLDNPRGRVHHTPLHFAVELPCVEIVQLLLDAGADPLKSDQSDNHFTPLLYAIRKGFVPNIVLLLQQPLVRESLTKIRKSWLPYNKNAKLNQKSKHQILDMAIKSNTASEVLEVLVEMGCLKEVDDWNGYENMDELLRAVLQKNKLSLAQILIQNGASVQADFYIRQSPLLLAVMYCDVDTVKLLLSHGADPNHIDKKDGITALDLAASHNASTDICEALLDAGCDVNGCGDDKPNNDTPLHAAVKNNNMDLAKLLIARGAALTNSGPYSGGKTVLICAVESKNVEMVELILNSTPDLNIGYDRCNDGNSALCCAVKLNCLDIMQLLLAKGASPDGSESKSCIETPLKIAVEYKKIEFVSLLIRYGLETQKDSKVKQTALIAAVRIQDIKLVEFVTQCTNTIVDFNAVDDKGKTALHYAIEDNASLDIIKLLLKYRAARLAIDQPSTQKFLSSEVLLLAMKVDSRFYIAEYLFAVHGRDKRLFDMTEHSAKTGGLTVYQLFQKQGTGSSEFIKCSVLFINVLGNVNSQGQFIPYPELVHQPNFKTVLFTPVVCCQFDVLCHGCYFLWFLLVQEDGEHINKLVSDIISAHPELATAKDASRRSAIDAASQSNKLAINSLLLWHGKYRVTDSKPEHTSATCFVFKAVDESLTDETDSYIPVALKLMRVKAQFEREVGCRAENFDSTFVVDVVAQYLPVQSTVLLENGDVEMPVIAGALTKTQAESMYCVVMPLADRNMFVALKQERFTAQAELTEVKHIFTQLVQCVSHMHSKGMLHGDLKTLNIVRTGIQWKLIDLDASCRIGVDAVGAKSSSAYVAPETIHADKSGGVAFVKSVSTCAEFNLQSLIAHPSFDVWSLGCLLYQMCSNGKTLFQASTDDNLSGEAKDMQKEDSLWGLAEWSAELKAKKLTEISNPFAANLLSLLLEKDRLKRPTLSRVLAHPFLTGKKGTRLVGEMPAFDVFISYRVASDAHHAEILYDLLTARGLKVWLDKKCLQMGVDWEQGFCAGLLGSGAFICLLSQGAVSHPTIPWQNFSQLNVESRCDNVLLEHRLALELREVGLITKIYPVLIGEVGTDGQYSRFNAWPSGQHTHVTSVETGLTKHMNNEGLGTPLHPNKTVAAVCTEIGKCNGSFIVGELTASFGAAADSIVFMLQGADEDVNIPHSPGKMSSRLRESVKEDQVSVLEQKLELMQIECDQRISIVEETNELLKIKCDKKIREERKEFDLEKTALRNEIERLMSIIK